MTKTKKCKECGTEFEVTPTQHMKIYCCLCADIRKRQKTKEARRRYNQRIAAGGQHSKSVEHTFPRKRLRWKLEYTAADLMSLTPEKFTRTVRAMAHGTRNMVATAKTYEISEIPPPP